MKERRTMRQRGDTLVEVTIAMAVLGLTLAATMTVINRSLMGVSSAVERTSSRGMVNSQIELLKYAFDTQTGVNKDVTKQILNRTKERDNSIVDHGCQAGDTSFYLSTTTDANKPVTMTNYPATTDGHLVADDVYAAPTPGTGIWIEGSKYPGSGSVPGYVDFYVRACWTPRNAENVGEGRLESTVRVYYQEGM